MIGEYLRGTLGTRDDPPNDHCLGRDESSRRRPRLYTRTPGEIQYSQGLEARSHVMSLKPRAQVYPPDIIVSSRRCRGIRGAGVGGANMSGARSLSTRRAVEMHNASSRMERIFFRAGFPFSSLAPSSSPGVQGVSLLHTLVVEPCNALSTFFTCTEYSTQY